MSREKFDIWVGFFVVLGVLALAFLALKAGNMNLGSWNQGTYQVKASFDNIGGLKPRAAVKSAGVVVGRVQSIEFDNQSYKAVVHIQLDKRYRFPIESGFKILTSGLLGEQYIGIDAGDPSVGYIEPNTEVKYSQSAIVLEDLISQFLYNKASEPAAN